MLASKSFPAALGSQPAGIVATAPQSAYPAVRRAPAVQMATQSYASPTESEFEDVDGPDSVKNWDEERVCEYLRSVKCGEYEKVFRKNHINGENLLEIDKEVLKEMGVEKVGDRVRLFLGIKKLRTKTYANQRRRNRVGDARNVLP
jgi:mitogen-activated protein kinase kinase kinase